MGRSEVALSAFATLALPPRPQLSDLVSAVEKHYGKALILQEVPASSLGPNITGQWKDYPSHGVIEYASGRRTWQLHVILHELGHIVLDHRSHKSDTMIESGFFRGVGRRKGVSWMFRQVDGPQDHVECAAEDLAYVFADALLDSTQGHVTPAERIFGL